MSRESPSPEGKREASVRLVGFWQHAAPGSRILPSVFLLIGTSGYVCAHIAQNGDAFAQVRRTFACQSLRFQTDP
eukprot:scaffold36699_cov18-Tisochrysis_lutea.AAC.1